MKQISFILLAGLGAAHLASAASCVPGTLASYMALGSAGCTIGANALANFAQGSALNGTVNIPPSGLNIFPAGGSSSPGIIITANVAAGSGQTFSTLLNYTITGSTYTSDTVALSNTTSTGNGGVTDIQNFCLNGNFQAPTFVAQCAAGQVSGSPLVVVGNGEAVATLNAASLGITHNLVIDSGITGTASGAVIVDQFRTTGSTLGLGTVTSVSAGNWLPIVAPNSIAAGFGTGFSTTTLAAITQPLPTNLGGINGVTVTITDSAGNRAIAPLFMVSPGQVNYLVPGNLVPGAATVQISTALFNGSVFTGTLQIANVAPAIFTADSSGSGPPAAQVLRVSNGVSTYDPPPFTVGGNGTPGSPVPIKLTPSTDRVYLILYGTGIQRHTAAVTATVGGISVPVTYAGAQGTLAGLDQINLGPLPQSLAGHSSANVVVSVDGMTANTVIVSFQ